MNLFCFQNMWDLTPDTDLLRELPEDYTFETALADLIVRQLEIFKKMEFIGFVLCKLFFFFWGGVSIWALTLCCLFHRIIPCKLCGQMPKMSGDSLGMTLFLL